ncbi:MAG: hypothetical protein J07HX5_00115 [halophilic archaeon J07HX5]|nr:MAG: hypothetical protein J07HX5_00115 [halophilic archaeon J07HX5]
MVGAVSLVTGEPIANQRIKRPVFYTITRRMSRGRTEDSVFGDDEGRCLSNHLTPRQFTH